MRRDSVGSMKRPRRRRRGGKGEKGGLLMRAPSILVEGRGCRECELFATLIDWVWYKERDILVFVKDQYHERIHLNF